VNIDCGVGTVPPVTTAGAGASEGSALVVESAAGAPGAAAAGAAAGTARGVKECVLGATLAPDESGPVIDGMSGVPAGMLLCASASEFNPRIKPRPISAIIAIQK